MTYKLYTLDNQFIEVTNDWPSNFTGIIAHDNGAKHWFVNGKYHRIDGPAYEHPNGLKYWYVDGKLHRLDGPADECADSTKAGYWYIHGKGVTEEQHNLLYSVMKLKKLT